MFNRSSGGVSPYQSYKPLIMSNHIPQNSIIGSKKVLFMLMSWYYKDVIKKNPFEILPKTYHLKNKND